MPTSDLSSDPITFMIETKEQRDERLKQEEMIMDFFRSIPSQEQRHEATY